MGVADVVAPRHLLVHHDTHPLALRAYLDRLYGDDWYDWDPQALWDQLEQDHGNTVSELSKTKIQAIRTLELDPRFWTEWEIFYPVVQAVNNRIPNFWLIQKPTVPGLYVAIDIASVIRCRPYDDEVKRFMAACFLDAGVTYAAPPLDFIQSELDGKRYHCPRCGQNADDDDNGECDHCGYPDIVRSNLRETGLIASRIQSILEGGYDILGENVADIQAARLKVALDYMTRRRRQLDHQLALVGSEARHA